MDYDVHIFTRLVGFLKKKFKMFFNLFFFFYDVQQAVS